MLSDPESRMIGEILEIKNREVNKVMIPKNEVVALAYNTQLEKAVQTYKQYHYSRYPVYFNNLDQVIGIFYIKDVVSFWKEYSDFPIVEFVRLPYFVYEDRSALSVF